MKHRSRMTFRVHSKKYPVGYAEARSGTLSPILQTSSSSFARILDRRLNGWLRFFSRNHTVCVQRIVTLFGILVEITWPILYSPLLMRRRNSRSGVPVSFVRLTFRFARPCEGLPTPACDWFEDVRRREANFHAMRGVVMRPDVQPPRTVL